MTDALHDLADYLEKRFADRDDIPEAEILDALFEWIDSRSWTTFSITYHADGTVTRVDHSAVNRAGA